MPDCSQLELVDRAKAGDAEAFSRLFDIHATMVYGLAYSTLRDPSASQDIVQEVFLAAWINLQRLRNPGAFPMWLRRMTRNLAISWLRSDAYRRALAQRASQDAISTEEQTHQTRERSHKVREALDTLSPRIRDALILYYLENQSVANAAETLGITRAATKSRLAKGRAQLRAYAESNWEAELREEMLELPHVDTSKRIAAHMAAGPIVSADAPALSQSIFHLWTHQLINGGPSSFTVLSTKGGILAMSANKFATTTTIFALVLGILLGTWYLNNRATQDTAVPDSENASRVADESNEGASNEFRTAQDATPDADGKSNSDTSPDLNGTSDIVPVDFAAVQTQSQTSDAKEHGKIEDPNDYVTIAGAVVDEKGNGVSGAIVTAQASGYGFDEIQDEPFATLNAFRDTAHHFTAIADERGNYAITGIEYEGALSVRATAFGLAQKYESGVYISVAPGDTMENVDVLLSSGVTATLRVRSISGLPVEDGIVTLLGTRVGGTNSGGLTTVTHTDADGRFDISLDGAGLATILVKSQTYGATSFSGVPINPDADEIELRMRDVATLNTDIRWTDGRPAEGITTVLTGWYEFEPGDRLREGTLQDGLTNAAGAYEFSQVDPGMFYRIELYGSDRAPLSSRIDIGALEPGSNRLWKHTIEQPIVVYGTVFGKVTGQPVQDVEVHAHAEGQRIPRALVDEQGRYEIQILSGPGDYHIYPKHFMAGATSSLRSNGQTVALSAGEQFELDLTLDDTFTMAVQVVDIAQKPLEGIRLGINEEDRAETNGTLLTDAEGRWSWSGFRAGYPASISVYHDGRERAQTQTIVGQPGETVPEEVLVLRDYGGIEGIATDPSGQPLANTEIRIHIAYGQDEYLELQLRTNNQGEFLSLNRVPATTVSIEMLIDAFEEPLTWISNPTDVPANQVVVLDAVPFAPLIAQKHLPIHKKFAATTQSGKT